MKKVKKNSRVLKNNSLYTQDQNNCRNIPETKDSKNIFTILIAYDIEKKFQLGFTIYKLNDTVLLFM